MEYEARILIVDESIIDIRLIKKMLMLEGYEVIIAKKGEDIVSLARKEQFDLILLDVIVPDFDGFEICKKIKDDPITKEIPVIFLTARYELATFIKGFEVGGEDYVRKPLIMSELISRVKSQIELAQARKNQLDLIFELQKAKDEILNLQNELAVLKKN